MQTLGVSMFFLEGAPTDRAPVSTTDKTKHLIVILTDYLLCTSVQFGQNIKAEHLELICLTNLACKWPIFNQNNINFNIFLISAPLPKLHECSRTYLQPVLIMN